MYSVHSSVFSKCGFTMRPILISDEDDALFNANFSPRVAVTYQNHIKEIRRMVKQQGLGFWIRFIVSFRSHNERHRLMDGIVFPRAEAVFVDMLHLLTCGDNLNELTRLVASLRAMQAAITANDYHVLMDPVLRVLMTCYDKPLDGLRLYFRFAAGLVGMFRRWRQVAWRSQKDGDGWLPWEPPLHWQQLTARDCSEWTLEGHLLCLFGAELPQLLGLPPGLPCWMPDQLKTGHMVYPAITIEEIPVAQDSSIRNNRNKKKGRRRKNKQLDECFSEYESPAVNAAPSSGDSGVCLIEQGPGATALDLLEPQKAIASKAIAASETDKEESVDTAVEESESRVADVIEACPVSIAQLPADETESCEQFEDADKDNSLGKPTSTHTCSTSPEINIDILSFDKVSERDQGDVRAAADICMRESDGINEEIFTSPYINELEYSNLPDSFSGDWKKSAHFNEDQATRARYYCGHSCQSAEWKLGRLRETGGGDSVAQNALCYMWTDDCPADDQRPDYSCVVECPGSGLVESGQYAQALHGGLPVLEQNYGPSYDQCLHFYRREAPSRIMMGVNNMRTNCQVEEMHHLGRPSSWVENPGSFVHSPPHMGYFDGPVVDYLGPATDMRRRPGQQNRRFRQKRGRQPLGPFAPTPECYGHAPGGEALDYSTAPQNDAGPAPPPSHKKQWQNRRRAASDTPAEGAVNAKPETPEEQSKFAPVFESSHNSPQPCTKDYALAVCGLLSKQTGKTSETQKQEEVKQEENVKVEITNSKFPLCDKFNQKKPKGKFGKQSEDEYNEKFGKMTFSKEPIVKEADKSKKCAAKAESGNVSTSDFGALRTSRGKATSRVNLTGESAKSDEQSRDFENNFASSVGKDAKSNADVRRSAAPGQEEEKVLEKRRKWKSVWTRRRDAEEKPHAEGNVVRDREMSGRRDSGRREGVPENVPDILKQVENSELKSFWKDSSEAPKPQRKLRSSKRDSKWRQEGLENSSGVEFSHNSTSNVITPVVKLDVVPVVEPKDKDCPPQDTSIEMHSHQSKADNCGSEIGWYEETLAEDKDRENGREMCGFPRESMGASGAKRHKNRKYKRKQRNNRRAKDERNGTETAKKESPDEELTDFKNNKNGRREAENLQDDLSQNESVIHDNDLNDSEPFMNNTPKDGSFMNGYSVTAVEAEQISKRLSEKYVNPVTDSCCLENSEQYNTQEIEKSNIQNICCHATITKEFNLNLSENSDHLQLKKQSSEEVLQVSNEMKTPLEESHKNSIDCCQLMLEEILNNIPDNINNSQIVASPEHKSNSSAIEPFKKFQLSSEPNLASVPTKNSNNNKENEAVAAQRRRQACVVRTLKYMAGRKFNFHLSSKRNFFRFLEMNGEILKTIEEIHKKDPGIGISSSLFSFLSKISLGEPHNFPCAPRKMLLLRRCDNCNVLEKLHGEFGECVRCKDTPSRLPRVYCNRKCQHVDWKRRHRAEHKREFEKQCNENDRAVI